MAIGFAIWIVVLVPAFRWPGGHAGRDWVE